MLFFKSKAQKELERNNQRKLDCINNLDGLLDETFTKKIPDILRNIEMAKLRLDDPSLTLSAQQLDAIETCIQKMKMHMEPSYSVFVNKMCQRINEVLNGKATAITNQEKAIESNEEMIAETDSAMENYYSQIDSKVKEMTSLESKIDGLKEEQEGLIENKAEWKMRFYKINRFKDSLLAKQDDLKNLEGSLQIAKANHNIFLQQNRNLLRAGEIEKSKALASQVDAQKDLVNTFVAEENAKYFSEVNSQVQQTGKGLDDLTSEYYGNSSNTIADDEAEVAYQRARENHYAQNLNGNKSSQSENDTKEKIK